MSASSTIHHNLPINGIEATNIQMLGGFMSLFTRPRRSKKVEGRTGRGEKVSNPLSRWILFR